ncbi:hypothetical protein [Riemerella anatipestifer]|uniref:Uncharacterized protein n=3 Tax=Riemerella anatipestifer TaxID=34085 RepID=A0A1A5HL95_RIEAN|nr:hypothetical protein [Riemerella anatipestifer]AQY21711.1 hypothetical protein AB406_0754 [Riemerella anatipestifer]AZZ58574.1 hypothetical protein AWB57_05750 [Riemerella anatipestifer]MCO4303255.1 hypothetical protein [Riemerella anatipestifer]MCO7318300.1 hypothetical protein [Riemerella anatipestifer]MCO7352330.1 hypothetical protein [Riemerella anatipestifer]
MRFKSILLLMIFLNFMALPSIAKMFGEDISIVTFTISEEETQFGETISFSEKMISEVMSLQDFSLLSSYKYASRVFISSDDAALLSPFLSVHYTPPEA